MICIDTSIFKNITIEIEEESTFSMQFDISIFRFEGEKCDLHAHRPQHGSCGDGLTCKKVQGGAICQCLWDEIICGTDNKTYT